MALTGLDQVIEQDIDEAALARFTGAMSSKLGVARHRGRGGWYRDDCSNADLLRMLREHLDKVDKSYPFNPDSVTEGLVDIANFCMFIHQKLEYPRHESAP